VEVTAKLIERQVEIRVRDYGDGILPEKLEHVFDRFYRGEAAATIPGFGLGLAIAKALVEGQGSEIVMESVLGEGSTVILRFSPNYKVGYPGGRR
jgi:signal transduction histidine kinase